MTYGMTVLDIVRSEFISLQSVLIQHVPRHQYLILDNLSMGILYYAIYVVPTAGPQIAPLFL
jgi:hypothetical protein